MTKRTWIKNSEKCLKGKNIYIVLSTKVLWELGPRVKHYSLIITELK